MTTHPVPGCATPPLEPDLETARRFLALLDPDAEHFVFQVFDDSPKKDRELARTIFGSLDRLADILRDRQQRGCGVFVTVNRTTGGKRRAEHVDLVRANFVDLDGAPLGPVMACDLEPHIVVESSPGKFHGYWLVEDVPLEQFGPVQKAIAARFAGDKSVHDLPRVMRLPGFVHQKSAPFLSRLAHVAEGMPYDLSELLAEFPPGEDGAATNGRDTDADAEAMAELVRLITTGERYHDPLCKLAYRYLVGGQDPADVVRTLQGFMDASTAPRDDRWRARCEDLPRLVDTAKRKLGALGRGDLTDDGLALEMGKSWAADARFCAMWNRWIFWQTNGWRLDETKLHLTRTRAWLREKAAVITQARPSMVKRAATLRDASTIAAVDRLACSNVELASRVDDWDQDKMLLGGPKTINLRTGEAYDPRPLDFIIKRCACAPAPPGTRSALWERFLDRVTDSDTELQNYLQRAAGYWLTGSVEEEVFFFLHGTGQNGKSKFLGAIQAIMGDYADTISAEMLMVSHNDRHPTELAKLRGLRLAIAYEIEHGRTWAESKIKALTGGDKITARYMRQDFFSFWPQFKLALIGNHKPSLRAVDEAIKRRMHLIPFTVTIPPAERDQHLAKKLEAEYPAILRWMIDGCCTWQRHRLNPPARVRAATDNYFAAEDSFELWCADCTIPDPLAWESSANLFASWKSWAERVGETVGTQRAFSNLLADRGFVSEEQGKKKTRGYRGAKLVQVADLIKENPK